MAAKNSEWCNCQNAQDIPGNNHITSEELAVVSIEDDLADGLPSEHKWGKYMYLEAI